MTEHRPTNREDSVQELFEELRGRVCAEGVGTYGEYRELVQELVQERLGEGGFDVNEDLSTVEADLEARWPEIEAGLR
ncbi:MAG: hypothetical protein HGA38_01135 [Candidatus Moranbacteria bacterium]|nr:hypothetical protein [Candidatus Moranbacteria bacterium]NTW45614.1 hypothetical protein [Candidatus Moranbacteria bacterium]